MGHLQALEPREAVRRLGEDGPGLVARARGEDSRRVDPARETKSISAETTFEADISDVAALERLLWPLAEKLARRLRQQGFCAAGVVLKLKSSDFAQRTRTVKLAGPSVLPDTLFHAARALLGKEADGTAFRLIGIGAGALRPLVEADKGDLADTETPRRAAAQAAVDVLRAKFGEAAVLRGRGLWPGGERER